MKDNSFPVTAGGLLVLIVAASLYVFDFSMEDADGSRSPSAPGAQASPPSPDSATTTLGSRQRERTSARLGGPEYPSQTEQVNPSDYSTYERKAAYEKEIIALATRRDIDYLSKADQLLGRMHLLPPQGKVLALEYATKLIPDRHYEQFRPRIFKAGDSDDVREAILLDLLTRGDKLRMTAMLEFLRQPATATHEEIRDFFIAYLDKDHGVDPEKWAPEVSRWLAENPED